jgi:hypothetical protein
LKFMKRKFYTALLAKRAFGVLSAQEVIY